MADPKTPPSKAARLEIERKLAQAFRAVEAQGAPDALKAHAERLSRSEKGGRKPG
jgi:hypothetical protein